VALAAAAAAWFITEQVEERQAQEEEASRRVVSLTEPLGVQAVELGGSQFPQPVRIERQEERQRWMLTQPISYPADGLALGAREHLAGPVRQAARARPEWLRGQA